MNQQLTPGGRIVVLISGRGSNLQALIEAGSKGTLKAQVCAVISDKAEARGLQIAAEAGIESFVFERKEYASRNAFESEMVNAIDELEPDLIVLAGFMRVLSDEFVKRYLGRLINIHPSLLPQFRGLHANEQALAAGVEVHGTSVHFVIPELDAGPVVVQAKVPVMQDDDVESLAARVLTREHLVLPIAAQWVVSGRCRLEHGVVTFDGQEISEPPILEWSEDD